MREPKERIRRRVRKCRKKRQEEITRQSGFIFELTRYFRANNLTQEWALLEDFYKFAEVYSLKISYLDFIAAIQGSKKLHVKPVRSIETAKLYDERYGRSVWLVRPLRIPKTRKRSKVRQEVLSI